MPGNGDINCIHIGYVPVQLLTKTSLCFSMNHLNRDHNANSQNDAILVDITKSKIKIKYVNYRLLI